MNINHDEIITCIFSNSANTFLLLAFFSSLIPLLLQCFNVNTISNIYLQDVYIIYVSTYGIFYLGKNNFII